MDRWHHILLRRSTWYPERCGWIAERNSGWPTNPERPWKPWILLPPPREIPWKLLKLQHTPEKLCSEADFPRVNVWSCSAVAFYLPVTLRRRIYETIGGKNSVSFVVWEVASFPNNRRKISSKAQWKWMYTGRRSIHDNHNFPWKHSQIYPGKPLKFGRNYPGKPWKRISFHCSPPWNC